MTSAAATTIKVALGTRSLVLIGLMGAGKSSLGRRLGARLDLPFVDADKEIEAAAGKTITEIFEDHGEAAFREGETKVIARLLGNGPQVLATGGGAFMNAQTRAEIARHGISIWLKADLDVLMERVSRRDTRPLLRTSNPRQVMADLMAVRYPVYGEADVTVTTRDVPHDVVIRETIEALTEFLQN